MTGGTPEEQLEAVCEALNAHGVRYVVFGSFAGSLQGASLRTLDVDIVPETRRENLQRLVDALNSLRPRWRVASGRRRARDEDR
jgi:predicted nucleotidyltransferase